MSPMVAGRSDRRWRRPHGAAPPLRASLLPATALLAALLAAGPATAQVEVLGSAFRVDVHPSPLWTEGAAGVPHWYSKSYREAGIVRAWVRNLGHDALTAQDLRWGGADYPAGKAIIGKDVVWWRLWPDPLAPGQVGEVEVRLRQPLLGETRFVVGLGGRGLDLRVAQGPQQIRIERVAFTASGDMVAWCSVAPGAPTAPAVILDGTRAAPGRYRMLGPWHGALAVVYRPRAPFVYGSFHSLLLKAGGKVLDGAVVRARDDFYPLGTYGYLTPQAYAANGLNLYASFGPLSAAALDDLGAYGLRGVSPVPSGGFRGRPGLSIVGNPALWAYYLHDEPDVGDYSETSVPHPLRIGSLGMAMCACDRGAYLADPSKLTYLTIDQTYRPADWFVYGPVADVCAVDHYPPPGREKQIVSTLENAREGCAPQMLVFVYSAWWPEPLKPKPGQSLGRMWYAGEERLNLGWAVACGAQGLICYIHCTEREGNSIFHGAGEFPDTWNAIGEMYGEIGTLAPVLATAWPIDGAVTAPGGVRARALASPEGLAVVAINDVGCHSTADDFTVKPAKPARLMVELPPWLKDAQAAVVERGKLRRLAAHAEGRRIAVTLPELDTVKLLLIATPAEMAALERRCAARRATQAEDLLRGMRHDLAAQAREWDLVRRLPGHYTDDRALATSQGTYGVAAGRGWLSAEGDKDNAVEWYDPKKATDARAQWTFKATEPGEHYFIFQWDPLGLTARLTVVDAAAGMVRELDTSGDGAGVYALPVQLPASGTYTVTLGGQPGKPSGSRVAKRAFLVPAGRADLLPSRILK